MPTPGVRVCCTTTMPTAAEVREALGWKPQPDLSSARVLSGYVSAVMRALDNDLIPTTRVVEMM